MDYAKVRETYSVLVGTYLYYRLGSEIGQAIAKSIVAAEIPNGLTDREAFLALLIRTRKHVFSGVVILDLVFDETEKETFLTRFLQEFDQADHGVAGNDSSFVLQDAFKDHVAPDLQDILGKELTERMQNIYLRVIAQNPGIPAQERFHKAMEAIFKLIPDIWSEAEFQEKVVSLQEELDLEPGEEIAAMSTEEEMHCAFAIKTVIIPDLADILGQGKALETVIASAEKKTSGIFSSGLERFREYVHNVLDDDFVTRMFDPFWIENKKDEWVEAYDSNVEETVEHSSGGIKGILKNFVGIGHKE